MRSATFRSNAPKLLRVLQEREFSRVGSVETLRVKARVIAATNQDLQKLVASRRFREDLYFRLHVIPINLPPLRDRREDTAELTDYFVAKAVREMGARVGLIAPEARVKLAGHDWPGNVRELENAVLRAALLAPGNTIRAEDIEMPQTSDSNQNNPDATAARGDSAALAELIAGRIGQWLDSPDGEEPRDLYEKLVAEIEKPLIELALKRTSGNQVKAARMLGLNRNTLRKKITDHKIVLTRYRDNNEASVAFLCDRGSIGARPRRTGSNPSGCGRADSTTPPKDASGRDFSPRRLE